MIFGERKHFSHPHNLKRVNEKTPYKCDGCLEKGFGTRFRCETCNYDLHEECLDPDTTVSYRFDKKCRLKFFKKPPGKGYYCDACTRDINGYCYTDLKCDRALHPCCFGLSFEIESEGIELSLREKLSSKCDLCPRKKLRNNNTGWCYESKRENYRFHVSCLNQKRKDKWATEKDKEKVDDTNLSLEDKKLILNRMQRFPKDKEKVDDSNLSLEDKKPSLILKLKSKKGTRWERIRKYWKIVKIVAATIVSICIGDPTTIAAAFVVSLISQ